jgi:hypothetical protein
MHETQRLIALTDPHLCGVHPRDPRMYQAFFGAKALWYYFYRKGNSFTGSAAIACPGDSGVILACMASAWLTLLDHGTVYCNSYKEYQKDLRDKNGISSVGISTSVIHSFPRTASFGAFELRAMRWHCPDRIWITSTPPSSWRLTGREDIVEEEHDQGKMDEEIDLLATFRDYVTSRSA